MKEAIASVIMLSWLVFGQLLAQDYPPGKYWIKFTDKKYSSYSLSDPRAFLSEKSIQRRLKHGISLDSLDIPVSSLYIDSIVNMGFEVLHVSKWFNAVTVRSAEPGLPGFLEGVSFVERVEKVGILKENRLGQYGSASQASLDEGLHSTQNYYDYGLSISQVKLHNTDYLHDLGFRGKGMHIAIIDAGFNKVDEIEGFEYARDNGLILGWKDFVRPSEPFFSTNSHGTSVFSVIGGYLPSKFIGFAPEASYWLLRSEDATFDSSTGKSMEYRVEEDHWIAAAEFADSAGADIINTSLGYNMFNDSTQNYSYDDMDGKTTRISRGANIAASRGMLVVVSAGNEGNSQWRHITAPGDALGVLTVGAVDVEGKRATFSSVGPTSDGRIKPEVVAVGRNSHVFDGQGTVVQGNGTSFAAPAIAGVVACLWQAFPGCTASEIINVVIQSSSNFSFPDNTIGYGIPDLRKSYEYLAKYRDEQVSRCNGRVKVYPVPFGEKLNMEILSGPDKNMVLEVFNNKGEKVHGESISLVPFSQNKHELSLPGTKASNYILRLKMGNLNCQFPVIKN